MARKNFPRKSSTSPTPKKKPYTAPRLVRFGSILKLTQSVGSMNGDGGSKML